MNKTYLGDGVYIEQVPGGLKMTTENGIEATNTIYLEPAVVEAFIDYVSRCIAEYYFSKK